MLFTHESYPYYPVSLFIRSNYLVNLYVYFKSYFSIYRSINFVYTAFSHCFMAASINLMYCNYRVDHCLK